MAFATGRTPFGTFDTDPQFQIDADKVLDFVFRKLGDPVMQVELTEDNVYASFEESCLEYSAIVNQYQAKSVLAGLLGTPTGSLGGHENQYPNRSLELQRRLAAAYADAAGIGDLPIYSGTIALHAGQQRYSLDPFTSGSMTIPSGSLTGSDGHPRRIFIKEIYHPDPISAYRFFGSTSAVNYLNQQFSFESFTPETVFYMLPIWEDVLRGMEFKMSNKVRRSNYSYEMRGNELVLYPAPLSDIPLFFTYNVMTQPYDAIVPGDTSIDGVANLSNVPFGNISYSKLNSIGKQWIRRYALALSKEVLGRIRGKFGTIPIPNGDVTLDGDTLLSEAKGEQEEMRRELREILDETTYDKLAAREAQQAQDLQTAIQGVPMHIYVGVFLLLFLPVLKM